MADPDRWLDELARLPGPARRLELLRLIGSTPLVPGQLARYHDALLFAAAYPGSLEIHRLAAGELAAFHERTRALDPDELEELVDSGIVAAPQCYPYDLANAEWLASRSGARVEIAWSLVEPGPRRCLARLVALLLDPVEAPLGTSRHGVRPTLNAVRGRGTAFDWLARRLRIRFPPAVAANLFNACDLPLRVEPGRAGPSRTHSVPAAARRPSVYRPLPRGRRFDFPTEAKRPLALGRPLSRRDGAAALGVVRNMILSRGRELHAMTHGNPDEVYRAPLDRGASLVVWLLRPEERLALEVGWYFMLQRHGLPVAYGGGGVFATRAEVGMNLFEEYRNGREAAWILAQVCRAALFLCPAPWIVTRRYQVGGEGNEEGIASGAYWFYDKLGFRSVDRRIRDLADAERARIGRGGGYRSSRRALRRLAAADVVLPLEGQDPATYREYPFGAVGLRLSQAITARFGPERAGLDAWLARNVGGRVGTGSRPGHPALFQLITEPRHGAIARRLARLKGARREAAYAAALPAALPWLEQLAARTDRTGAG